MSEQTQAKFEGWAIVDVLGHQRYVGYVTTEAYGQAVLFRIAITPCTKEAALVAVEQMQQRPLMSVALPPERALPGRQACPVCHDVNSPCECETAIDDDAAAGDFEEEALP